MTGPTLIVDVHQLLLFFDESDETASHANAIKAFAGEELAFALLLEYFQRKQVRAERLKQPCTTGSSKGPRLDGWIRVFEGARDLYYQVEVKTWSRHSIGGRALAAICTETQLSEFKKERWARYWLNTFKDKSLVKVLEQMKPPVPGAIVEPLACLWDAVHPSGSADPLFSVDLPANEFFKKAHIFSVSSFLRSIPDRTLQLQLPCVEERMSWLARIFPRVSTGAAAQ